MQTGDKDRFIRFWYECSLNDIQLSNHDLYDFKASQKKWFMFNNGGDYRKWYGNLDLVVDWEDNGRSLKSFSGAIIPSESLYFNEAICWPRLGSGIAGFRTHPQGFIPGDLSPCFYSNTDNVSAMAYLNSKVSNYFLSAINPTVTTPVGDLGKIPYFKTSSSEILSNALQLIDIHKKDWDNFEVSIDFASNLLIEKSYYSSSLENSFEEVWNYWHEFLDISKVLENKNNSFFIEQYSLGAEISPDVGLHNITLFCNPYFRYGQNIDLQEGKSFLCTDTIKELILYGVGCMMGRYSVDKPGLILASQGETLQDYLNQIPNPRFMPDSDAILPLTDQEWFTDDVTNRVREFVKVVWGEETLQENLAFIAESLCLHAIKPKKSEGALDTIRRYLSTQFYKDHLKTYKKRPIYWLFSSGKEKAFECLVYLHRYNESTLARMRTEYVTPLMGKYDAQHSLLLEQKTDASPAQQRELEKEIKVLEKKQTELRAFDEQLKHYADMRIKLDLDDGVKVNYGKFGNLLAEVKAVTGDKGE